MQTVMFFNNNRSGDLLHVETEGCIVNIRVNLHDPEGRRVTSVEILPSLPTRLDGTMNNRLIEMPVKKNREG